MLGSTCFVASPHVGQASSLSPTTRTRPACNVQVDHLPLGDDDHLNACVDGVSRMRRKGTLYFCWNNIPRPWCSMLSNVLPACPAIGT